MKIAYQKYPLVGNYTHPWVLLTIIIKLPDQLWVIYAALAAKSKLRTFTHASHGHSLSRTSNRFYNYISTSYTIVVYYCHEDRCHEGSCHEGW